MSQFSGKPLLAVPLGDAAGIGPEIIAKLCANGFLMEHAKPILVGDESVLRRGMKDARKIIKDPNWKPMPPMKDAE